ncbi:hypothetical protein D3C77_410900 [compost metagenome]
MVSSAVSEAKSTSWIRPREAVVFSMIAVRLLMVLSRRFCTAPRSARWASIPAMALSSTNRAFCAESASLMSEDCTEASVEAVEVSEKKALVALSDTTV